MLGVTFIVEMVLSFGDKARFPFRTYLPWRVPCLYGCSCCDVNITCIRNGLRHPFRLLRYKEVDIPSVSDKKHPSSLVTLSRFSAVNSLLFFMTQPGSRHIPEQRSPLAYNFLWFGWSSQLVITGLVHLFASVFKSNP